MWSDYSSSRAQAAASSNGSAGWAKAGLRRAQLREPSLRANGSRERAPDDRLREAIHSRDNGDNGLLRRFRLRSFSYGGQVAPRNDVAPISDTSPPARGAMRPSHGQNRTPRHARAWGMPGARGTRSLACKIKRTRAKSPQVHQNNPAFPHAMVLTVSSLRHREQHARKIKRHRADFVHRGRMGPAQVTRGGDGGVAIGAVDDVEAQQLFLGFGEGPVGHRPRTLVAQHTGSLARPTPRRRSESPGLIKAAVSLVQTAHDRRLLLRGPSRPLLYTVLSPAGLAPDLPRPPCSL